MHVVTIADASRKGARIVAKRAGLARPVVAAKIDGIAAIVANLASAVLVVAAVGVLLVASIVWATGFPLSTARLAPPTSTKPIVAAFAVTWFASAS